MNDIPAMIVMGASPKDFADMIVDQFDVLHAEGADNARIMPIALHPFVAGQAFRSRHIRRAFESLASRDNV